MRPLEVQREHSRTHLRARRRDLRRLSVIEAVRRHFISRGQAAGLLGVSLWDIDDVLAEHNVPTLELTPEELLEQSQPIP